MFFIAAVFTVHGKAADLFAARFQGVVDWGMYLLGVVCKTLLSQYAPWIQDWEKCRIAKTIHVPCARFSHWLQRNPSRRKSSPLCAWLSWPLASCSIMMHHVMYSAIMRHIYIYITMINYVAAIRCYSLCVDWHKNSNHTDFAYRYHIPCHLSQYPTVDSLLKSCHLYFT